MPIYFDCNSTTPVEPTVAAVVKRFLEKDFGNPASPIHDYGVFARTAADHARGLPGIDSDKAIAALKDVIAVSSTSACTSHTREPSHVLVAMGCSPERVESSLRFSWCHMIEEVDWEEVSGILSKLRIAKGVQR